MDILELRTELGLSLEAFAARVGLASRGRMSVIERENRCSLDVAIAIEGLSGGRIDAADLNDDVRAARMACRHACTDTPTPAPASPDDGQETIGPEKTGVAQAGHNQGRDAA